MIGIHDIGGYHNLGPIQTKDDEVFHEDWEGLTFGLLLVAGTVGTWALDEFRHIIEQMPPARYLDTPYYVHWLEAIEELVVRDGFVSRDEINARQQAIREGKPLPDLSGMKLDPAVVEKLREGAKKIAYVGLGARRPDQKQNFSIGDRVRARIAPVPGHSRLPRFIWHKPGTIVAYSGTYPLADTVAHRKGENAQPTYAVRFEGKDLWGDQAEPNTSVTMDLYECYMDLDTAPAVAA
ncbi:nitrile hydratase subunit beta [Paraburkholderia bannensis]|uniref:Nitrile hydratase subunit beta n=1 Tax=Paraburkholderia tropica TaxID=92647 RepID=A0AAQ1GDA0_9BURK|nr:MULTISPECIES: nitrile hydratase subunit beta [Paraburkholderia]RQM50970.1 nitrile hydratase subunit beta [Paraburkholderia bannensis]RQN40300.1 nitrile hydratase subunit beta [Paraburkholderia tropica]SEJ33150.1 nitrile hydratase [Paraburkholderia tropica]